MDPVTRDPVRPDPRRHRRRTATTRRSRSRSRQTPRLPPAGRLTVNAVAATGVGSTSVNRTGAFTISSRVDYTSDTGFGRGQQRADPGDRDARQRGLRDVRRRHGPRRQPRAERAHHRLLPLHPHGTDRVGNAASISTVVRVDLVAPTQTFSLVSPVGAAISGTRIYFRGTVAGSFSLAAAVTDAESGPASTTFPVIGTTGWTHNVETVSVGTGQRAHGDLHLDAVLVDRRSERPRDQERRQRRSRDEHRDDGRWSSPATTLRRRAECSGQRRRRPRRRARRATTPPAPSSSTRAPTTSRRRARRRPGSASSVLLRAVRATRAGVCGTYDAGTVLDGRAGAVRAGDRLLEVLPHRHRQRGQRGARSTTRARRHQRPGRRRPDGQRYRRRRRRDDQRRTAPAPGRSTSAPTGPTRSGPRRRAR